MTRRRVGMLISALLLTSCSEFNMAPACSDTSDGLRSGLLGSVDEGATLDWQLLRQIVSVTEPVEVGSAYNERTCQAVAGITGESTMTITYRVQQSEGLKDWYGVEFLNVGDPALLTLADRVRSAYETAG